MSVAIICHSDAESDILLVKMFITASSEDEVGLMVHRLNMTSVISSMSRRWKLTGMSIE